MSGRGPLSHLLVMLQLVAMAGCCYPVAAVAGLGPWAGALIALGIALGVATLAHNRIGNFGIYPEPVEGARLVTTGPYRWIRHPMYSALLMLAIGVALYNGHWVNGVSVLVLLGVLIAKVRREERLLPLIFSDYAVYAERTWRLVPKVW